jgi:hypothetical protein
MMTPVMCEARMVRHATAPRVGSPAAAARMHAHLWRKLVAAIGREAAHSQPGLTPLRLLQGGRRRRDVQQVSRGHRRAARHTLAAWRRTHRPLALAPAQ